MIDDRIYYLDKNNKGQADQIITGFHITRTDNPNPNLSEIYEVEKISCAGKVLYEPQWGLRGLSEDETAVATLMIKRRYITGMKRLHRTAWKMQLQMRMPLYC